MAALLFVASMWSECTTDISILIILIFMFGRSSKDTGRRSVQTAGRDDEADVDRRPEVEHGLRAGRGPRHLVSGREARGGGADLQPGRQGRLHTGIRHQPDLRHFQHQS